MKLQLKHNKSGPTAGEQAGYHCSNCDSKETYFEEYQSLKGSDVSDLGIICYSCETQEDPNEFALRFEPE